MRLFPEAESRPPPTVPETPPAAPRVLEANRMQVCLRPSDLESLLPAEHPARTLWACVERLDLTPFYAPIAGGGSAGDPARLCEAHDAYRWICGGVSVNYHTLSDFRVAHQAALDALLTETLAVLLKEGLITLTRVAQDGTPVRARAGAASFRREPSLRRCLAEAEAQVRRCAAEPA